MNVVLPDDVRETTPTMFVIFGATGDLSLHKLLPALFDLYIQDKLPLSFQIVAFARRPFSHDSFRELAKPEILVRHPASDRLAEFLNHIRYEQGLFDIFGSYEKLGALLSRIDEKEFGACSNKLFYLAV